MANRKSVSISRNFTINLVVVIIIFSACFTTIYFIQTTKRQKQALEQRADNYISSIVSTLEIPLWNLDRENIQSICTYYSQNELISEIRLTGSSGEVLFSETGEKDNQIDGKIVREQTIFHNGENIGEISFTITPEQINEQRFMLLKAAITPLLISIAVLILLTGFLFNRFLKVPLKIMKGIADEYSKGNYHPQITSVSYREFEPMVSVLVEMGEKIDQQMGELQKAKESLGKHRDHLEKMVSQRTEELRNSNRKLMMEIEERQQAVKTLMANEQRLDAILKASPVGIALIINRNLYWGNDAVYKIFGYQRGELRNKNSRVLYTCDEEYERVQKEFYRDITRSGLAVTETQLVHKNGTVIDCVLQACALEKSDPSKGQIIAVLDISKTKTMETQLLQAKKMEAIGTLAGGVAHDLNNILSGIVSYPEMLLLDIPKDSSLRKPLETIQRSGEKAVEIVQDLLTMARRGVAIVEIINSNQLITEQLQSPEMEKLMKFHPGIKITTNLSPQLLNIKGSSIHISKSIMNLLSNAAEAMPDKGEITISTSNIHLDVAVNGYEAIREGDYVKLTISDTGVGIAENDIEKIFEPFYTKKKMGRSGTGLGMAVVWGTVKDHGGYIDIKSQPNEGTTFDLYLPVTREEQQKETTEYDLEEYMGNQEFILVVDDIVEQREIATSMLKRLGYSAASVFSGEEAVAYIKEHDVDLILLDMIMQPGIDGLETYRQISEIRPNQKAIIASGFSQTERVKQLQALGVGQYLKKPYTLAKIGKAIKNEFEGNTGR